jgi:integrase
MQFIKNKKSWAVRFYHEEKRIYLKGFRNKKEAELGALKYIESDIGKDKSNMQFQDFIEKWFYSYASNLADNTKRNYADIINLHIIHKFGKIKISEIKSIDIQNLYYEKMEHLSSTRVNNIHKILKLILKYAVDWGYIKKNPCNSIKSPSVDEANITIPEREDIQLILNESKKYDAYIAIYIAIVTGMRSSEILSLEINNIDLINNRIYVKSSYNDNLKQKQKTKTSNSNRYIYLIAGTEAEIKKHIKDKIKHKEKYKNQYIINDWICTFKDGKKLTRNYISKTFKKVIRNLKLDDNINFKSLRHYHATWLLTENIHPKIVQERLGHSSIRVTLDTYSHLIPSLQEKALINIEWAENRQECTKLKIID